MKRLAWFVFLLVVPALSGCVTETVGGREMTPDRLRQLAKARTALAADYYQRKQYAVSLEELALAMRADPDYSPAYSMRALVHVALLEDGDAERDFQRSLDLDPKNSEAHDNYGWFLCERGRQAEGVKQHLLAAKDPLYPQQGAAYMRAGECAIRANQLGKGEVYLEKAQILQPNLAQVYFDLAGLSFITGDYQTAESRFNTFRKAVRDQLAAEHLLLGVRIENKLGNRRAEADLANRLRANFPDSREAKSLDQIR